VVFDYLYYNQTMNIEVMGTGCPTCKKLLERTQEAVKTLGLEVTVDYITDVEKIISLGFMRSPILTLNGKAILVGEVPSVDKIKELIKQNV
jgi:small redox-active disulfide protein 2